MKAIVKRVLQLLDLFSAFSQIAIIITTFSLLLQIPKLFRFS